MSNEFVHASILGCKYTVNTVNSLVILMDIGFSEVFLTAASIALLQYKIDN